MEFFDQVVAPSLAEGADVDVLRKELDEYVTKRNNEFTTGLRTNKDEILAEKRALDEAFTAYKEKYATFEENEFTADSYNSLMAELDRYKASSEAKDEDIRSQMTEQYEKGKQAMESQVKPTINSLELKLNNAIDERDKFKSEYHNHLSENALRRALNSMGAEPSDFWFDGFKNKAQFSYDDQTHGLKNINVWHEGNYLPLEDWKKVFPTSKEGKRMIKPGPTLGAGSHSSAAGGAPTTLDAIESMTDPKAQMEALAKYYANHRK